jgi:hypothetical protein
MQARAPVFNLSWPNASLFSCLCVTEDRPAFVPWLLWNFDKQRYAARELIVVDSSREPVAIGDRPGVTVVRCPPGTSVGAKRNIALDAARGSVLTWFDDDDWQHPAKLSILARAMEGRVAVAGPARSFFVDVGSGRARAHELQRGVLFNGIGVRRGAVEGVRFDERRAKAADTAWMKALGRQLRTAPATLPDVLFVWLCHRANLSNPSSRYVFRQPLGAVRRAVGGEAWGDTDDHIRALRERLGPR